VTHHTTTQQEIIDIKCAFQSYYMKKYILIHFEIQKKLIVVGLFLLLAGFRGPQANFTGRSLSKIKINEVGDWAKIEDRSSSRLSYQVQVSEPLLT
jgi:hypothetical protein